MKRLLFAATLAFLPFTGPPPVQPAVAGAGSFIQVSVHRSSRGNAVINEVAIASLPGDPLTKLEVDGDQVTVTHYCR